MQTTNHDQTNTTKTTTTTETTSNMSDYLWQSRFDILYQVRLSALYHRKREGFYDLLDKLTKLAVIVGGSAVFANTSQSSEIGIAVAIAGALSLVFDYGVKARNHAQLAQDYGLLESEIEKTGERDFSEKDTNQWHSNLAKIESKEPPALTNLVKVCETELYSALGQKAEALPWYKKATAHFAN
jgi:hypothetical protein